MPDGAGAGADLRWLTVPLGALPLLALGACGMALDGPDGTVCRDSDLPGLEVCQSGGALAVRAAPGARIPGDAELGEAVLARVDVAAVPVVEPPRLRVADSTVSACEVAPGGADATAATGTVAVSCRLTLLLKPGDGLGQAERRADAAGHRRRIDTVSELRR